MREKFGAFLVLVWHFGLEWLVQFPPHSAHTGPEPTFLFKFITLVKHNTGQNPENRPNKLHFPPITVYSDSVLAVLYAATVGNNGAERNICWTRDPDLTVLVGTLILRNSASLHRTGQGA